MPDVIISIFSTTEIELCDLSALPMKEQSQHLRSLWISHTKGCFSTILAFGWEPPFWQQTYTALWVTLLFLAMSGAMCPFLWVPQSAQQWTRESWMRETEVSG